MNGQKHTYRYAAICIISELYFRQFCRAFGLREIIVMLIILICYRATLCACFMSFCLTSESDDIFFFILPSVGVVR
jgi:hypothetical protein